MNYPKRPPDFGFKLNKQILRSGLPNLIGPEACWLLTTIAAIEDGQFYSGPVRRFNDQLMVEIGVTNIKALDRIRKVAVESGWLHYEAGGKGVSGIYWVTVPDQLASIATNQLNEYSPLVTSISTREVPGNRAEKCQTTGGESGRQPPEKWATEEPIPGPSPKPSPSPASEPEGENEKPSGEDRCVVESVLSWRELEGVWNSSGLLKCGRTHGRHEALQAMCRNCPQFKTTWRNSIARLARNPANHPGQRYQKTIDNFLTLDHYIKVIEGNFDLPKSEMLSNRTSTPTVSRGSQMQITLQGS